MLKFETNYNISVTVFKKSKFRKKCKRARLFGTLKQPTPFLKYKYGPITEKQLKLKILQEVKIWKMNQFT